MSWYAGKKVFVVGGSAGIGKATAVMLARQGAHVIVAARGKARLEETVEAMKAASSTDALVLDFVQCDVTDGANVKSVAADVLKRLGGLDVLICNSGFAHTGISVDADDDQYDAMLGVNFLGHVRVIRAFLPHFVEQGHGDISLVSSMLGFMGLYGYGAYAASKFAIRGFAEALRQEMALFSVRVTVFYPPTTDTPGLEAENESKDPVVWALEADSGWNKTYSADEVATALLKSVRKGRFENVVGMDSWFIFTMNRHFPTLTRWLADMELRTAAKKVAERETSENLPSGRL
jgi:3-dehydrosphinganine reductase